MNSEKVVLIIMDGWGIAEDKSVSAIDAAKTPFYDHCLQTYPHTQLRASELEVGLPQGQMGNSEVGHMNIGAGRIVYQELVRINLAMQTGDFAKELAVQNMIQYCKTTQKPLHLLGLLSDGGVHSSIEHLKGILTLAAKEGLHKVYIHAFTDGRDTAPNGGQAYLQEIEDFAAHTCGKIATIIGRYYAMDRDKRWERVKLAYDLLVHGKGAQFATASEAIQASYAANISDEFVAASVIGEGATISEGDAVLFYNFRTDRGRELTEVLTQTHFADLQMQPLNLHYTTLTRYDDTYQNIHVVYEKDAIENGLGEYLASQGKTQIRMAETEKYPHVTFFFNGGRETPFEGETRIMRASPKVATYDLAPEMSANDLKDALMPELEKGTVDFVCINFANPDMVGHTGVFEAAIKACETVDHCTQILAELAYQNGYTVLITADHGNADKMRNPDGSPHTAHTLALVPLILMDPQNRYQLDQNIGKLGDIAPTILKLMNLDIPPQMTGNVLVK